MNKDTAREMPQSARPDAWCAECEQRRLVTGEWEAEAARQLQPRILCGECYDLAKRFHMGEEPWQ